MTGIEKVSTLDGFFRSAGRAAIVSHVRPDGDAAGSSVALASYLRELRGIEASIVFPTPPPDSLDFITAGSGFTAASLDREGAERIIAGAELLICLDFNTLSRAEELEPALRAFKGPRLLIDHHVSPEEEDFDLVISCTEVSSTCELLFSCLMQMPDVGGDAGKLPARCAEALMTGMTTDTNNFANSVFPSTLEMASALLSAGVDRDAIIDALFCRERENRLRAEGEMLSSLMKLTPEGAAVTVLPNSFFLRHGLKDSETEGFVNLPLAIGSVKLSILAREDGPLFRVSLRSKKGTSARLLAVESFHGGGHEQAAGGRLFIPGDIASADGAGEYVLKAAARFLQQQASAQDEN